MTLADDEIAPTAGRRVGRYKLFGELASGGLGSVHLATVSAPGGFKKVVAIKRLHPQFRKDRVFSARFLDEARLSARIAHANVVQTLDAVEADGEVLLVMEYVHGEALSRLLETSMANGESVPIPVATAIIVGALQGLAAAHETRDVDGQRLDLVHRDVSPQNILVGVDGVARLLDFGIARAVGQHQLTPEGQTNGKIGYMAPEQLHGERLTAQADLYACSIVLWELLTGARLFAGETDAATLARVMSHSVLPPSELRPDVPVALNRVALRGLARNPKLRFESAAAMAAALEAALPMASSATVAAWVRRLAARSLAHRAEACASCERASDTPPLEAISPRPRRQRRGLVVGSLALLAALAFTFAAVPQRLRALTKRASASASASGPESSAPAAPPIVTASSSVAPQESLASVPVPPAPVRPAASAVTSTAPLSVAVGRPAKGRLDDCNPPWVIDADGRKRFKRQCL